MYNELIRSNYGSLQIMFSPSFFTNNSCQKLFSSALLVNQKFLEYKVQTFLDFVLQKFLDAVLQKLTSKALAIFPFALQYSTTVSQKINMRYELQVEIAIKPNVLSSEGDIVFMSFRISLHQFASFPHQSTTDINI